MTNHVAGLVPILATPFDSEGNVDFSSLRRLVEFQVEAGADGLAVFGMASEAFALVAEERFHILSAVREVVGDAYPIVAGISPTSTVAAIEQVRGIDRLGIDQLMVLPPYLVKPSRAQVIDFYGEVAAATGIPVMVQDAARVTGVTLDVALLASLSRMGGIVSVKVETAPTAQRVSMIVEHGAELAVFGGNNALFVLDEYANGAIGTMPACEFTDLLAPLVAAPATSQSRDRFEALLPLITFGMQPGLAWAVHKHVLVRRGLIAAATVRSPAQPLDHATMRRLDCLVGRLWP